MHILTVTIQVYAALAFVWGCVAWVFERGPWSEDQVAFLWCLFHWFLLIFSGILDHL